MIETPQLSRIFLTNAHQGDFMYPFLSNSEALIEYSTPLRQFTSNEEPACRKICAQFQQDFGKWKHCLYEHPVEFSSKKLMRYQKLCIDAQNPSRSFQNKSHSSVILRQELTENNIRKWRVRYDFHFLVEKGVKSALVKRVTVTSLWYGGWKVSSFFFWINFFYLY
jgi:hypothetical protein